jgi:hypothetical protein
MVENGNETTVSLIACWPPPIAFPAELREMSSVVFACRSLRLAFTYRASGCD